MKTLSLKHIGFILLIICFFVSVIYFVFIKKEIKGEIVDYAKSEEKLIDLFPFEQDHLEMVCKNDFNMTEETTKDFIANINHFSGYWVHIKIENITNNKIYKLAASLDGMYENLWLDKTTLSECQPLDLEPSEIYENNMFIIVRSENMTEEEIDNLINDIRIKISSIFSSTTIVFKPYPEQIN